jgi:hypothetical protein|uniref:Uncharacterized protein n=2 Tax=Bionectria ochroleuca TaxID=29856 RepID=A0A8H7NBT9_BIOOC
MSNLTNTDTMRRSLPTEVDFLVLGAGWTSDFLIPLLEKEDIAHAATTRDGRNGTIAFTFDPESEDEAPFRQLPASKTVLITFPLKGKGPSLRLTDLYAQTHGGLKPNFIQLGVTSIWTGKGWQDHTSPYDKTQPRAIAEDELMAVAGGAALDLSGLFGGARQPRHWVDRVIKSKADLRAKGALHIVHGEDVARAIVALHRNFTPGQRWLLTNLHVYDWWTLIHGWALEALRAAETGGNGESDNSTLARHEELLQWVGELMEEEGVKALPRDSTRFERALDGRAFWAKMGILPLYTQV